MATSVEPFEAFVPTEYDVAREPHWLTRPGASASGMSAEQTVQRTARGHHPELSTASESSVVGRPWRAGGKATHRVATPGVSLIRTSRLSSLGAQSVLVERDAWMIWHRLA